MPGFLTQPDQHVRLPVQTPLFKMSSTAHAPYHGAFKEFKRLQADEGNVLLHHIGQGTYSFQMQLFKISFSH